MNLFESNLERLNVKPTRRAAEDKFLLRKAPSKAKTTLCATEIFGSPSGLITPPAIQGAMPAMPDAHCPQAVRKDQG